MKTIPLNHFLYDGDCPFCSSLAVKLETTFKPKSTKFLSFRELTEDQLAELHPLLTLDLCERDPQLIWNQKRYPGFFAFRQLLFDSPRGYFLIPVMYIPLVPFLGMLIFYLLKRLKT